MTLTICTIKKILFNDGLQLGDIIYLIGLQYFNFLKTQIYVTEQELMTVYNLKKKI